MLKNSLEIEERVIHFFCSISLSSETTTNFNNSGLVYKEVLFSYEKGKSEEAYWNEPRARIYNKPAPPMRGGLN